MRTYPVTPFLRTWRTPSLSITHTSGAGDLVIEFVGFNFTLPAGPNLFLSAASTGNWNVAAAGDNANFQAWAHADNSTVVAPGTATAITPQCNSGGPGTTLSCATQSGDVPWARLGTAFSLSGRETIHQSIGSVASYQSSINALATSAVPEPATSIPSGN